MTAVDILIAARGGGAFTPPSTTIKTLTAANAGGWTQIPEPRAVYYNGKTYFGYVNGTNGNVEIRTYTHETGVVSAATVLHVALESPGDTHDAPAIIVRDSDKKLVCVYSAHRGAALYVRISTNIEDISAFDAEVNIDSSVGATDYTYPIMLQRLAEANDPIYVWFRDGTTLKYTKSTTGGLSWTSAVSVYANGAENTYWKIATDGQWRIDFFVSSKNPDEAASSIYHFYADDTDYHKSDGTVISGHSQPWTPADLTLVYDTASAGPAWVVDGYLDSTGKPRFVYSVKLSGSDSSFRYARWTGSAWTLSTIVSAGAGIVDPSPVACLDEGDERDVYLVRKVSGKFELYRYRSADNGATFAATAITSGSSGDNLYPVDVKNRAAGLVVLWLYGTYTSATSNALGIKGVGY